MTETQFQNLLKKLGEQFRPSQIGSNKGEWLAVGNLINDSIFESILDKYGKILIIN